MEDSDYLYFFRREEPVSLQAFHKLGIVALFLDCPNGIKYSFLVNFFFSETFVRYKALLTDKVTVFWEYDLN
jgi:hypothetical protein